MKKGQTMVKRKRTNNGQEKKDKQWSREKGQTMDTKSNQKPLIKGPTTQ